MPKASDYLHVKEAAKLLGIAPNTISAWGERWKIPEYRHPANIYRYYLRADLERLLGQLARSAKNK